MVLCLQFQCVKISDLKKKKVWQWWQNYSLGRELQHFYYDLYDLSERSTVESDSPVGIKHYDYSFI